MRRRYPGLLFPSEEDAFSRKRREGVVPGAEAEVNSSHYAAQTDQLEPVQHQHQDQDQDPKQDQDHLTLLTSLNKQTTSLLQTYSQSQSKSENGGDFNLLERALVLGQVALVLASSLIAVSAASGDDRVVCRLAAYFKARAEVDVEAQAQAQREVAVALPNMGVALVKQFDRTGDRRDLKETRWTHARDGGYSREREPHLAQPPARPLQNSQLEGDFC
ncbi:hypothetical protein GE21DRAFT_1343294 [Neurospora crassa]|nr:hypothetical protein GE21DRAFT_1343294 [Neurospora crassa]